MSLVKYYDALFEDEKLNNEYVTYLSAIHMNNVISKRDNVTNSILKDLGANYSLKAYKFYENALSPLIFLNDDIQVIYDYTKNHINKILENPHAAIVKEQKLIKKEKLKSIDAKSLRWLANKPGSSIREKLANTEKISSTVKRYSYNIKENQVVLAYFKDISKLLGQKINIISENKELFGDETLVINKVKRELNKTNYSFKNVFEEVVEKDHLSPNNALIGNVDYSSIWSSYIDLKQNTVDYSNAFEFYKKSFINMFVAYLMNYYDFIEDTLNSSNVYDYILYGIENNILTELLFDFKNNFTLTINKYDSLNKIELLSSIKYVINFDKIIEESSRGLVFNLIINDEQFGKHYADILGFKEVVIDVLKYIDLKLPKLKENNALKNDYSFISINSFDNKMYSNNNSINLSICDNGTLFRNNSISFANGNNLYFYSYKKDNYSRFLKMTSSFNDDTNRHVIYDINDTFDEFSSASVRRAFSSVYPNSYPVWRSILAGESSWEKEKIKTVIDFCGKNFSISKLERKNDRFIHCGPIEVPIYYQIFNEFSFYESYISRYEKKYNISFSNNVKNEFMSSGSLHSIFCKESKYCIVCDGSKNTHKFYLISYDDELFESALEEFEASFENIIDKYEKSSTISILPDFLESLVNKYGYIICNKYLINGANVIVDRLKKSEITWYEKLPKLSLEIIKDGMFDNLVLVDNQECENIIGKKFRIVVRDRLTLGKGNKNYILPLNKSFIGEQNDSFVAKAEDPSFPLNEDLEVRLIIEYSFGAENSYVLKLIPVSKQAPFEEIIVKWEKEEFNNNDKNPSIIDVIYNNAELENQFNEKIPYSLKNFSFHMNGIKQNKYEYTNKFGKKINNLKEACTDIQVLINKQQRISHYTFESKEKIRKMIKDAGVYDDVCILIEKTKKDLLNDKNNDKYKNILVWRLSELEEALVELSFNPKLFTDKVLVYPEACYGRYFAENPSDKLILNIAYNQLVDITSNENFFEEVSFRRYMNKLTSATAVNHMSIYEMAKANPTYISYLLKVIVKTIETLSVYDWNKNPEECSFYNTPKENGFLIRYCVELLISFLYCRDLVFFNDLKPGGKLAKEIIFHLKNFNRNIIIAMKTWDDEVKKAKMLKTKYHISLEKPIELINMWNEAYCLILYLSGDERANYIKIGSGD